jgi:hypothetical protein
MKPQGWRKPWKWLPSPFRTWESMMWWKRPRPGKFLPWPLERNMPPSPFPGLSWDVKSRWTRYWRFWRKENPIWWRGSFRSVPSVRLTLIWSSVQRRGK